VVSVIAMRPTVQLPASNSRAMLCLRTWTHSVLCWGTHIRLKHEHGEPKPTFLGIAILFDDSERMSSLPSREVCSHAAVLRTDWVDRPIRRISRNRGTRTSLWQFFGPSKGRVLTIIENAALRL
jgi:hypothetical protein